MSLLELNPLESVNTSPSKYASRESISKCALSYLDIYLNEMHCLSIFLIKWTILFHDLHFSTICIPNTICIPARTICIPARTICIPARTICIPARSAFQTLSVVYLHDSHSSSCGGREYLCFWEMLSTKTVKYHDRKQTYICLKYPQQSYLAGT